MQRTVIAVPNMTGLWQRQPEKGAVMVQLLRMVYERIFLIVCHSWTKAWCAVHPGVKLGSGVRFKGMPMVDVRNGARLEMGEGAMINSRNFGYHLNMFANTKLFVDRPGALLKIGKNSRIHGTAIHAATQVIIGENCLIAANCQIMDCAGHDLCLENPDLRLSTHGAPNPVLIENSVWLGEGVIVMPGVTIGEGAVVAARSVVTRNVSPRTLVAGAPAVPVSLSVDR